MKHYLYGSPGRDGSRAGKILMTETKDRWDFPGRPAVWIPSFQRRDTGSVPAQGSNTTHAVGAQPKSKTKMKELTKDKCKPASSAYGATALPAAKDTDTDTDVLSPTRVRLWSLHGAVAGTQSAMWERANLGQRTEQVSLGFL